MTIVGLEAGLRLLQGSLETSDDAILKLSEDEIRYVDVHSGGVGADPEKVHAVLVRVFPVVCDTFFLKTYDRLIDRDISSTKPLLDKELEAFDMSMRIASLEKKFPGVFSHLTNFLLYGSDGRLASTLPYAVHAKTALLAMEKIFYFFPFVKMNRDSAFTLYCELSEFAWKADGAVLDRGDRWGEHLLEGNKQVHRIAQDELGDFSHIQPVKSDRLPRITGPSSSSIEVLTGLLFGSKAQFRLGPISVGISQLELGENLSSGSSDEKVLPDFCVAVVKNPLFRLLSLAKIHVLSHELGHAVAGLLFGARDVRIHVCDSGGGVVHLILPPETACWKQTVIDAAGPLANVAFSSALIAGAVSGQEYISTPVAGVLAAGSLSWMFGESMYAITSAAHANSGDFGKIARRGSVHLSMTSLTLAVIMALGVWNFLQFFTFDTDFIM